ncbi:MAG TPA: formimidoylglutamate deiminase, partial [Burkholderiaceae bacterium]|nr:formimidoylglutamate deiminase [Burkholderiaceae bacterium]
MNRYFATDALLPAGWRRDVTIDVTDGGDIAAVGVSTSQPREAVRLAGPVMPGMANLHSHAFQRAMAGLTEVRESPSDDFWSWRELMYRFVARLTPELAHDVARHLYVEMLRNGYTAVAEFHYVHNDADGQRYADDAQMLLAHLTAAREAGLAATMLPVLYRWSNFGCKPLQPRQRRFDTDPARVLAMVDAVRREASRDPDVRAGVAPHSLRAVDPGSLRELLAGIAAIDASAPVHVHAAEQVREVDDCIAATGLRPVEWLLATQPVDARWCLVHATQMTAQETDALARSGAIAGLCPSTEGNLGDGVFPLLAYRAAGGRYGIGGDSHVSRDP